MKPLIVCFNKLSLPSQKKCMSITPSTLHQNGITVREGGGIKDKTKGDLYNLLPNRTGFTVVFS